MVQDEVFEPVVCAVAFSDANRFGLGAGQFAVLAALVIFGALWAQARGRPVLAGVLLALGTIKVATMLPFLLLFARRKDRLAWLSLPLGCLGLYLLTSPAAALLTRLGECLHNIDRVSAPGGRRGLW